ncbi:MAG: NAD-dependent epimerase/dehydratase family protein [Leptospirales bacterium]|nr:NAD-dependent epimerase/dehydratase family protein [Leptospirales bacterium]
MKPIDSRDLGHFLEKTRSCWETLGGKRVFITGGSGFVGRWLLETILYANARLGLSLSVGTMTRDAKTLRASLPHLVNDSALTIYQGGFAFLKGLNGEFDFVVHAAADTRVAPERADEILASMLDGTRIALDFTERVGARDFLLTSSGAAYGRQPPDITHLSEEYPGKPDANDPSSAYGEGKRLAELMCARSSEQTGIRTKIARLFAFVGPHLALDRQYAAGNFIRDALRGETIRIAGDGTDLRSYLYAADMAIWLWTILFRGEPGRIYNVGSDQEISIEELAKLVAQAAGSRAPISIAKTPVPGKLPARYIPSTARARTELHLQEWVPTAESIKRTVEWFRDQTHGIV